MASNKTNKPAEFSHYEQRNNPRYQHLGHSSSDNSVNFSSAINKDNKIKQTSLFNSHRKTNQSSNPYSTCFSPKSQQTEKNKDSTSPFERHISVMHPSPFANEKQAYSQFLEKQENLRFYGTMFTAQKFRKKDEEIFERKQTYSTFQKRQTSENPAEIGMRRTGTSCGSRQDDKKGVMLSNELWSDSYYQKIFKKSLLSNIAQQLSKEKMASTVRQNQEIVNNYFEKILKNNFKLPEPQEKSYSRKDTEMLQYSSRSIHSQSPSSRLLAGVKEQDLQKDDLCSTRQQSMFESSPIIKHCSDSDIIVRGNQEDCEDEVLFDDSDSQSVEGQSVSHTSIKQPTIDEKKISSKLRFKLSLFKQNFEPPQSISARLLSSLSIQGSPQSHVLSPSSSLLPSKGLSELKGLQVTKNDRNRQLTAGSKDQVDRQSKSQSKVVSSGYLNSPISLSSRGVLGLATKTCFSSPRKQNTKDQEDMPKAHVVSSDRQKHRKVSLLEDKTTFDFENKPIPLASFQRKSLDFQSQIEKLMHDCKDLQGENDELQDSIKMKIKASEQRALIKRIKLDKEKQKDNLVRIHERAGDERQQINQRRKYLKSSVMMNRKESS